MHYSFSKVFGFHSRSSPPTDIESLNPLSSRRQSGPSLTAAIAIIILQMFGVGATSYTTTHRSRKDGMGLVAIIEELRPSGEVVLERQHLIILHVTPLSRDAS